MSSLIYPILLFESTIISLLKVTSAKYINPMPILSKDRSYFYFFHLFQ